MQLKVVKTFISRFLILFLSFGLVIFSTNMWGSEGKGEISMVIANAAIVSFFSGIFAGSSTSFFAKKYPTEQVLGYAYLMSILIGIIVPLGFGISSLQKDYLGSLIGISVVSSLLSANINMFVGTQKIKWFNIYTVLQQLSHVVLLLLFIFVFNQKDVSVYFTSQIIAYSLLFITSSWQILQSFSWSKFRFSKEVFQDIFRYGWKTQLSVFIQFLNYRLSFYFLEHLQGISAVGIFSIGITFSEAIWTVTRSLAVILYSDVLNSKSREEAINKAKSSLKLSFWLCVIFILGIVIIPANVYELIFGEAFKETKYIMLLLAPGILSIGVSDMIGYYFSAIKELKILNIKAIAGLVFSVAFSLLFIPKYGILGACVATTSSYVVSALFLMIKFYKSTSFKIKDYLLSSAEIELIKQKFSKK